MMPSFTQHFVFHIRSLKNGLYFCDKPSAHLSSRYQTFAPAWSVSLTEHRSSSYGVICRSLWQ